MSEKAFKIGPEYLNEALREAEINAITMTKTRRGKLHLDTKLSGVETINRLISGLALLYSKLFTARDQLERQSSAMDTGHPAFNGGPEYLNEAFREADIKDITMTKTSQGRLHLDTDLSGVETINRLISGLALLYSKLFAARRQLDVGNGPIGEEEPTDEEIEAARRNSEQTDPKTRAELVPSDRSVPVTTAHGDDWLDWSSMSDPEKVAFLFRMPYSAGESFLAIEPEPQAERLRQLVEQEWRKLSDDERVDLAIKGPQWMRVRVLGGGPPSEDGKRIERMADARWASMPDEEKIRLLAGLPSDFAREEVISERHRAYTHDEVPRVQERERDQRARLLAPANERARATSARDVQLHDDNPPYRAKGAGYGPGGPDLATVELQARLHEFGHQFLVDGRYGVSTEGAVQAFQRHRGLNPSGEIDAVTFARLFPERMPPIDPSREPDSATEVNPSNTPSESDSTTKKGMTGEEYNAALEKIPGGYFFDTIADVDGALDPGETVLQLADLPLEDRQAMTRKFAEKKKVRDATTVDLTPQEAVKLRDEITGKANADPTDPTDPTHARQAAPLRHDHTQTAPIPLYLSYDVDEDSLTAVAFGAVADRQGEDLWRALNRDFGYLLSEPGGDEIGFLILQYSELDPEDPGVAEVLDGPRFDVPVLGLRNASAGEIALAAGPFLAGESSLNRRIFDEAEVADGEAAARLWRDCLQAGDSMGHYGLGYTLFELGRFSEAYRHLRAYTELAPGDPWAWCWLGRACHALGETQEAGAAYRRAIELSATTDEATDADGLLERLLAGESADLPDPREEDLIRETVFDSAVYLDDVELVRSDGPPRAGPPVALFLAGGPLSGKSTVLSSLIEQRDPIVPPDAVLVDPRAIREQLPEWQQLVAAREPSAAETIYAECCDLARRLTERAVAARRNLIIDGIGGSWLGHFGVLLVTFTAIGYEVRVLFVDAPIDVCEQRNDERAASAGLYLNPEEIRTLHIEAARAFVQWKESEEIMWSAYATA